MDGTCDGVSVDFPDAIVAGTTYSILKPYANDVVTASISSGVGTCTATLTGGGTGSQFMTLSTHGSCEEGAAVSLAAVSAFGGATSTLGEAFRVADACIAGGAYA